MEVQNKSSSMDKYLDSLIIKDSNKLHKLLNLNNKN